MLRVHNCCSKSEPTQLIAESMDTKNEVHELNKNLYEQVEPYATGFLKVSDVHTIYFEQSGNPSGHVSNHTLFILFYYNYYYSFLISCLK